MRMKTGSQTLLFLFDESGSRIGFILNGSDTYYYQFSGQGDIVGLIDGMTGDVVARYFYDSWGKLLKITDASGAVNTNATFIGNANPFRYVECLL